MTEEESDVLARSFMDKREAALRLEEKRAAARWKELHRLCAEGLAARRASDLAKKNTPVTRPDDAVGAW